MVFSKTSAPERTRECEQNLVCLQKKLEDRFPAMYNLAEQLREIATVYDNDCGVKGQLRFASMQRRAATWPWLGS
jgi:hypothetical protein